MPPWLRSESGGERFCVARAAGVAMDAIFFFSALALAGVCGLASGGAVGAVLSHGFLQRKLHAQLCAVDNNSSCG